MRSFPTLQQIRAEQAKRSLPEFIRQAWGIAEPGTTYYDNWHIQAICEHLKAVSDGEIKRLLINMPPRHMKSLTASVFWPAWAWLTRPSLKWMFASYSLQLSMRDTRKSRQIIESDWYARNWGHIYQLREDLNTKSRYENTRQGYRMSVSTHSALTGEGGDIIVVDDPHNAMEADSTTIREATLQWWDEAISSRLNDPNTGRKVIIMQRLHEDDLAGHVLQQGGYEHLMLPEEFEPSRRITTCLGWTDPRENKGELLWPERVGPGVVAQMKRDMGTYGYVGQYQQAPVPAGGGIFKSQWILRYDIYGDVLTLHGETDRRFDLKRCWKFMTVDLASSLKTMADYTVISTFLVTPDNDLVLLDVIRDRLEAPDQERAIVEVFRQQNPDFVSIETIAYQMTMAQRLIRQGLPIREYRPQRDKVSRARTASIKYENGSMYHPRSAPWLVDCEQELLTFPNAKHDDFVDTVSQAAEQLAQMAMPNIRSFIDDDPITPAEIAQYRKEEREELLDLDEEW